MPFPIQATARQRATTVVLATVLPLALLVAGAVLLGRAPPDAWFLWPLALLVPLGLAASYAMLTLEMSRPDEATLECRSLLRRRTIRVADITRIDVRRWNRGMIAVRVPGTTIFLYRAMPGALEALRELAARHPSIDLRE